MIEAPSLARPGAPDLILASGSRTRATMLQNAGLDFDIAPAAIDEAAVKHSLMAQGALPHQVADTLAELKATGIAQKSAANGPAPSFWGRIRCSISTAQSSTSPQTGPPPPTICTASPASAIISSPPLCC